MFDLLSKINFLNIYFLIFLQASKLPSIIFQEVIPIEGNTEEREAGNESKDEKGKNIANKSKRDQSMTTALDMGRNMKVLMMM